jgi:hypothetical protein
LWHRFVDAIFFFAVIHFRHVALRGQGKIASNNRLVAVEIAAKPLSAWMAQVGTKRDCNLSIVRGRGF